MVAQQQGRFEEAEAAYRRALEIYQQVDQRRASATATSFGGVLAMLGRHLEAVDVLLDAAVDWYELTAAWDPANLQWLKRERQRIGDESFTALVNANVRADLRTTLINAVDKAHDIEPSHLMSSTKGS
jgi:hypothetical protein